MSFSLVGINFEYHHYDERGDVLYLNVAGYEDGPPPHAYATPEGHGIEYDEAGNVISVVLVNVKHLIERDGELRITWPEVVSHVPPDEVTPALAA